MAAREGEPGAASLGNGATPSDAAVGATQRVLPPAPEGTNATAESFPLPGNAGLCSDGDGLFPVNLLVVVTMAALEGAEVSEGRMMEVLE